MRSTATRSLSTRTIRTLLALAAASPLAAHAATTYTIATPGLYDDSASVGTHTAANGVANNTISFVNTAGAVAGTAERYASDANAYNASGNNAGDNAWYYDPTSGNTFTIGLTDAAYTVANSTSVPNGLQNTTLKAMDTAGDVAGSSTQYFNSTSIGTTAWLYTAPTSGNGNGTTTAIHLTGDSNVVYVKGSGTTNGSEGSEGSTVAAMNASGVVVGTSARYNASNLTIEGSSAWIASGSNGSVSVSRIGLTGTNYSKTTDANYQSSSVVGINANGQATGTSLNYSVNASGASDAWFYDGHNTQVIGLTGISNTDPNYGISGNYIQSTMSLAPTNGGVAGASTTTGFAGSTAWVYKIASNVTIPVSVANTTVANGGGIAFYTGGANNTNTVYQSSSISFLNASGQAAGFQQFYAANGTTTAGNDAIFFNGTTTQVVGLTSANYTAVGGTTIRSNTPTALNDNGQMAGTTAIYNGGNISLGREAWYYAAGQAADADGNFATRIGLPYSTTPGFNTAPYTNPITGARSSSAPKMNTQGQVAGNSLRYLSDGTSGGSDAYVFTPGGTSVQIGIFGDSTHSFAAANGTVESSTIAFLNNTGLVAGTSVRYTVSGTANGQDAWVYDTTTATNYPISLPNSMDAITGAVNETVQALTDNGIMLGSYTKYDPTTNANLGTFAYAFTKATGAYDLGLNTTNLTAAGWQQLGTTFAADASGDIVGYGTLANDTLAFASGSNQAVYLLKAPAQNYLLGDANLDGKVDLNDLNIVLNHLGETSSLRSDGNFDGAATIDLNDLNDVLNNLGTSLSSTSIAEGLTASTSAVPEPASLGLLALGGVMLLRRRR